MSRVSIIIPCYNSANFLEETLKSVFTQSFQDYEIILVDDGSSDATRQIMENATGNVRKIYLQHQGASVARNHGTALAKGEFIQYLDSDDLLAPDAVEKRVRALQLTDADVAYSDWQKWNEKKDGKFYPGEIIVKKIEDVNQDVELALFSAFWAPPAALMYRRRMVERIGGWNESLPVIQDARFLQEVGFHGGKFVHVPGVGAIYRVHQEGSLSRRDPMAFIRDVFQNACQVGKIWKERDVLTVERRKAVSSCMDYTARVFFKKSPAEFQTVVKYMRETRVLVPWGHIWCADFLMKILGYNSASCLMKVISEVSWGFRRITGRLQK